MLEIARKIMLLKDSLFNLRQAREKLIDAVCYTEESNRNVDGCWVDHFIEDKE